MQHTPPLKLGITLDMPLVGAYDNASVLQHTADRCVAQLARVAGH